jgi:hypothetical protein
VAAERVVVAEACTPRWKAAGRAAWTAAVPVARKAEVDPGGGGSSGWQSDLVQGGQIWLRAQWSGRDDGGLGARWP